MPTYDVLPGKRQFAGTPQQQALRRMMDDPNTSPEQRAYADAHGAERIVT